MIFYYSCPNWLRQVVSPKFHWAWFQFWCPNIVVVVFTHHWIPACSLAGGITKGPYQAELWRNRIKASPRWGCYHRCLLPQGRLSQNEFFFLDIRNDFFFQSWLIIWIQSWTTMSTETQITVLLLSEGKVSWPNNIYLNKKQEPNNL